MFQDEVSVPAAPQSPRGRRSPRNNTSRESPELIDVEDPVIAAEGTSTADEDANVARVKVKHVTVEQHALGALELYARFIRKGSPYEVHTMADTRDKECCMFICVFEVCVWLLEGCARMWF